MSTSFTVTPTPVSALAVGNVILTDRDTRSTVFRLQPLPSGRIRVWVKANSARWSQVSESVFGTFAPDDTVQKQTVQAD
jgi:hypothetical protein